ncbi:MAG: low molecular weight phosphatase family protein [Actinobacteria bacterium]|nr:low molecular weight phosphatase family protein [Actinomycetota bacterium]
MASILVVCTGNVCRSPLAEGFLREALGARSASSSIDVASAGTMGWDGSSADPLSVEAGTERGIDISGHVARRFSTSDVREADLVLGMAPEHVAAVIRDVPDAEHKAFTLKGFVRLLEALAPAGSGDPGAVLVVRVLDADALRRSGFEGDPGDDDIVDPLGRPLDVFRSVAAELDGWCGRLADGLLGRAPATTSSSNED